MSIFHGKVPVDANGLVNYVDVMTYLLKIPPSQRNHYMVNSLVPYAKTLPFFKNREFNESEVADLLCSMTLKEV